MSIKAQELKVKQFLTPFLHRTIENNHPQFTQFIDLLKKQPSWEEKINKVRAFKITRSRLNKSLLMKIKVDNCHRWLTVSWRKCISRAPRKSTDPLTSALRQAIRRQVNKWKKEQVGTPHCTNCGATKWIHVDHKNTPFVEIVRLFLKTQESEQIPCQFDYHRKTCGRKFQKKDAAFASRWKYFHKQHASFQFLCRSCNLSKKRNVVPPKSL